MREHLQEVIDDAEIVHAGGASEAVEVDRLRRVAHAGAFEVPPHFARACFGRHAARPLQRGAAVFGQAQLLLLDQLARVECQQLVGRLRRLQDADRRPGSG